MSDTWETARLRPHPENAIIFGDPEESEQYEPILSSIRKHGIWEPLAVKSDGTIVSGHLRFHVAQKLGLKTVPTRVVPDFSSYRDEVEYLIRCNTDRRHLSKMEVGMAFKRLRELPKEQGGTKGKRGGDRKSAEAKNQSGSSPRLIESRSRDEAATLLGVGTDEARALEVIACTPGVPDELKAAVNKGSIAPTPAAKAVRAELKRQGGEIVDASALQAVANTPARTAKPAAKESHGDRMAEAAEAYERDYRELFELYKRLDGVLTRRPLKSLLGPTEHHQYAGMVRDISIRAWREIESVTGPSDVGKQMTLTVLNGGKS